MRHDGGAPMRRDTIFRLASTSKPIAVSPVMVLLDECKLHLDDPVDKWLPELADRQVLKQPDGPLEETVPARRADHCTRPVDLHIRSRSGSHVDGFSDHERVLREWDIRHARAGYARSR